MQITITTLPVINHIEDSNRYWNSYRLCICKIVKFFMKIIQTKTYVHCLKCEYKIQSWYTSNNLEMSYIFKFSLRSKKCVMSKFN